MTILRAAASATLGLALFASCTLGGAGSEVNGGGVPTGDLLPGVGRAAPGDPCAVLDPAGLEAATGIAWAEGELSEGFPSDLCRWQLKPDGDLISGHEAYLTTQFLSDGLEENRGSESYLWEDITVAGRPALLGGGAGSAAVMVALADDRTLWIRIGAAPLAGFRAVDAARAIAELAAGNA